MTKNRFFLLFVTAVLLLFSYSCTQEQPVPAGPKNIILFVGDGMGFNHVDATSLHFYGRTGQLLFESPDWVHTAQATYPAIMRINPEVVYAGGYNPRMAWEDPDYIRDDATDSGASATSLSTGVKTYNNAIGLGPTGDTLYHISQRAKDIGKAAGVITSVQLSHATPAGFVAHNEHRHNYVEIAQQMILKSRLDVLMGCGHPHFNDNRRDREPEYRFVGGEELWSQLAANSGLHTLWVDDKEYIMPDVNNNGQPTPWTLITDSAAFDAVARGEVLPARLLGVPEVHRTLQQKRSGSEAEMPWEQARVASVPSLDQMTRAAVNVLSQNENGFFLMIEGGAIDWAGHDNHSGRLIEEMEDFILAIQSVVEWVETHSSWEETLVIVTSDHETGMLVGSNGENPAFAPDATNTIGELPAVSWASDHHTNSLVPLYARGNGSELFRLLASEHDPVKGPFLRNTDVAKATFLLWE